MFPERTGNLLKKYIFHHYFAFQDRDAFPETNMHVLHEFKISLLPIMPQCPLCWWSLIFHFVLEWRFVGCLSLYLCVYIIMYCTNRIMDMLLVLLTFTMYYSTCMCLSSGLIFLQRPLGVQSLKKIVLTLNMYLSVLVT